MTELLGLDPVGETPKLETGWLGAGLHQLRVKEIVVAGDGKAVIGAQVDGGGKSTDG